MTQFAYPILELAYVHKELYEEEGYHFKVSYLMDITGRETVVEVFPTSLDALMNLPMIDIDTDITVYKQKGDLQIPVMTSSVRNQL